MFDWLFRHFRKPDAGQPSDATVEPDDDVRPNPHEALSRVVWMEPEENPFDMRVLDCRPFATTMISVTSDPAIAEQFAKSRQSNGDEYQGQVPANPLSVETDLTFPHNGEAPEDGAVFLAHVMEDKWDIFLHDGYLHFVRSWTGAFHFRARIEFGETEATVTSIDADSETVDGDPEMAIRQVDFLIKSHLYNYECPHPVPNSMRDEDHQNIALWSFSCFGRRGYFGTFEDTTAVRIPRRPGD